MKLGVIRRINKDDLARFGDIPKWLDSFLSPLNDFIEKAGLALQNRLTFEDNFLCRVLTIEFVSGTAKSINPFTVNQSNLRVIGVIPLYASGYQIDKFGWAYNSDSTISVTVDFVTATSGSVKLLILYG